MNKMFSFSKFIRILSVSTLLMTFVLSILSCSDSCDLPGALCASLFPSAGILLCVPVARQNKKLALICASFSSLSAMSCCALKLGQCLNVILPSTCLFLAISLWGMNRFMNPRAWFGEDAIWCTAQEYSGLVFSAMYMLVGEITIMVEVTGTGRLVVCAVLFVMYGVLYYRAYTGHTVFISKENEKKIMDMNRLSARSRLSVEDENELVRLKVIYARTESTMNEKKPFLDPDFSLENLAVLVYCNRGQLSRAINTFSGMNFKSYLNRHRVDYALGLIDKDPRLKVSELSVMSGFHTTVSFTMAFKQNVSKLPSDYLKERITLGSLPV